MKGMKKKARNEIEIEKEREREERIRTSKHISEGIRSFV